MVILSTLSSEFSLAAVYGVLNTALSVFCQVIFNHVFITAGSVA